MFLDFLNNNSEDRLEKLLDRMYENPINFTTIKTTEYPIKGDTKDMKLKLKTNETLQYPITEDENELIIRDPMKGFGLDKIYPNSGKFTIDLNDLKPQAFKMNIKDTGKEYEVEAELPGIKKENITLEVREDKVVIKVDQVDEVKEEKENYLRKEIKTRKFERTEYLADIDKDKVKAKLEDGLLKVTIGKIEKPEHDYKVTIE